MCEGSQRVGAVGSSAPLHMAEAKEVNREGGGKVCGVHCIGCGEAVQEAAMGYGTGAADTTDGEWCLQRLDVVQEGGVVNGMEGARVVPICE